MVAVGRDVGEFFPSHSLNQAKRPALARFSCDLSGSKYRCCGRRIDVISIRRPLRCSANSARVKHIRFLTIESPEIVRAALSEIVKDVRAFEEERPFLRKECFELAKVDDRRIHFHLTKI